MGNKSYQLTSAGRSANHGPIGRHWLAGNSYFPCGRIFIFCFSEPLGINSEVSNSLLLGKPTKTNQIHMTLRPKYGDHQVQHTAQDT